MQRSDDLIHERETVIENVDVSERHMWPVVYQQLWIIMFCFRDLFSTSFIVVCLFVVLLHCIAKLNSNSFCTIIGRERLIQHLVPISRMQMLTYKHSPVPIYGSLICDTDTSFDFWRCTVLVVRLITSPARILVSRMLF